MLSILVVCGNCSGFFSQNKSHCATKNLIVARIKVPVVTRFHRSVFRCFFLKRNVKKKIRVSRAFPLYINFKVLVIQESIKSSVVLPVDQTKENGLKGAPAVVWKADVVSLICVMEQGYLVTNCLLSFPSLFRYLELQLDFLLQEIYKLELHQLVLFFQRSKSIVLVYCLIS